MNRGTRISAALLLLIPLFGYGQAPQVHLSSQVELPVRRLYQQLVSRPIGGIPTLERMKSLSPYLSGPLLNRITQARACGDDWFRLHPQNDIKAPLPWLEFGLFSGADDRSGPRTFEIQKMESEDDGSFRAYVRLTEGVPPQKPWTWRVAAVVVSENKDFVVNDVVFLRDKDIKTETRLSEILTRDCDEGRWVGFRDQLSINPITLKTPFSRSMSEIAC
jgi:hypothetical protein